MKLIECSYCHTTAPCYEILDNGNLYTCCDLCYDVKWKDKLYSCDVCRISYTDPLEITRDYNNDDISFICKSCWEER